MKPKNHLLLGNNTNSLILNQLKHLSELFSRCCLKSKLSSHHYPVSLQREWWKFQADNSTQSWMILLLSKSNYSKTQTACLNYSANKSFSKLTLKPHFKSKPVQVIYKLSTSLTTQTDRKLNQCSSFQCSLTLIKRAE